MAAEKTSRERVVIVGAGFAGLSTAKALAGSAYRVTVVDRHNYHLFQPLLYQVATAALSPADIASPIRGIPNGEANLSVVLGDVTGVDVDRREVFAEGRRFGYDHLILATGAQHAYFVVREVLLAQQPNKAFATVGQMGAIALFLAGEAAASITGIALPADGGWTTH